MKNLKKVVALSLAAVMMFGMMVVGAGAASYKDTADSDYTTAIEVVSAVEIISGNGGNFNPDGKLCRGDAALLASRIELTPNVASNLSAAASSFPDVPANAYYAGAVAWAAKEGYLNGQGDGNFNPKGDLLVWQFAKVLLNVLGYKDVHELTDVYAENLITIRLNAAKAGLMKGLENLDWDAQITRGQAAQMAFNAMQADVVDYTESLVGYISGGKVYERYDTGDNYLWDVYSVRSTPVASDDNKPAYVTWTKTGSTWSYDEPTALEYVEINAQTDLSDYTLITDLDTILNGKDMDDNLANVAAISALCGNGKKVEICVDDDVIVDVRVTVDAIAKVAATYDKINQVWSFTVTEQVTSYFTNPGTVTYSATAADENALYNALVALGIEAGKTEYAVVKTDNLKITGVELADTVSGKVTKKVTNTAGRAITDLAIDGAAYKAHANFTTGSEAVLDSKTLVLDSNGYFVLTTTYTPDTPDVPTNYIFVTDKTSEPVLSGSSYVEGNFKAIGYDLDGNDVTISVDAAATVGKLYTYTDADNDGINTLSAALTAYGTNLKGNETYVGGNFVASGVTTLRVWDTDGKGNYTCELTDGLVEATGANVYLVTGTDGDQNTVVVKIVVTEAEDKTVSNVIFLGAGLTSANAAYEGVTTETTPAKTYVWNAYKNGEKVEIALKQDADLSAYSNAGYYKAVENADGTVTLTSYSTNLIANASFGSTSITKLGDKYYYAVDSTQIYELTDAAVYDLVNTTPGAIKIADAADLFTWAASKTLTVSFTFDKNTLVVSELYITDIA